jgi:hypothetical protein
MFDHVAVLAINGQESSKDSFDHVTSAATRITTKCREQVFPAPAEANPHLVRWERADASLMNQMDELGHRKFVMDDRLTAKRSSRCSHIDEFTGIPRAIP